MDRKIKSMIIYIIAAILVIIGCVGFKIYKDESLSKTINDTLYKYFKENNNHISSHEFSIKNIKIKCKGNKAYIVEFDIHFDDDTLNNLNKLGATIYKKDDIWNVKGFGSGLTGEELNTYNFRCYN